MRVNCFLCGKPQNAPETDTLTAIMVKSKKILPEEIENTDWKYVCSDCSQTEKYWEWTNSLESVGHIALAPKAKISE
jgi:hypothetical protein